MSAPWENKSYVARSKYRRGTIEILEEEDQATSTQIAELTNFPQPHISRALSELRERGLVELLVPEEQSKGRFYGLTDLGREIAEALPSDFDFEWKGVKNGLGENERMLVDYLRMRYGSGLRAIGIADQESVEVLFLNDHVEVDGESVEKRFLQVAREAFRSKERRESIYGDINYDIIGTPQLHRLIVYRNSGEVLGLSIENDENILLPDIVQLCADILDS